MKKLETDWSMYVNMYAKHVRIVNWKSLSHVDSLPPHGLFSPWNSPGQNTEVGSCSHLQGIFPNQGLNPSLLHCEQILYQLRHKGRPRILEWIAYPFSSRSSQPRNQTRVSCNAGGFFYQLIYQGSPSESRSVMSDSLQSHGLYNLWNTPGQMTEVGTVPFRGSSQPRDWTQASHIAGGFFTSWATREAHSKN